MSSLTLMSMSCSQINIERSITNKILKSLWCMSCPHWSWRLGSHGFPLSGAGVFLITWFHSWISFTVFLQEHRFLLTTCLFQDTNSDIYCIFKLPRTIRSQHCCHKLGSPLVCPWLQLPQEDLVTCRQIAFIGITHFVRTFLHLDLLCLGLIYFGNLFETENFCAQLPFKQQL